MNLSEYNIGGNSPQTCLFIGDSGAGKSIAAGYWPKPLYYLSLDGRMGSVAEWHRGTDGIYFDIFTNFDALDEAVDRLESNCPYKTIVLDGITNLSSLLLRYSMGLRGIVEYDEETGRASKRSKGKKKGRIDVAALDDYQTAQTGILELLMNLKVIGQKHGVNIIFTAHLLTIIYTKAGGQESAIRREIVTAGSKIVPIIPTQFDEVYHFHVEMEGSKPHWKIKTYNDGIVSARSSFLLMPQEIDWTEKNLYEILSKYYVREENEK